MAPIRAKSVEDLLGTLGRTDISVPHRTRGRTTEHCERWSICRFLATYTDIVVPKFPVEIHHQDRPDFLVKAGQALVGIEVTEVVAENAASIAAYREHHGISGPFPLKRHSPNDQRLRGSNLAEAATSQRFGPAWAGNASEREWAEAIQSFIKRKVEKASKPGFELYPSNWLLMYDGWRVPALDRGEAAEILFHALPAQSYGPFQTIFIETGSLIWQFQPSGYSSRSINDLWADS